MLRLKAENTRFHLQAREGQVTGIVKHEVLGSNISAPGFGVALPKLNHQPD